MMNAKVIDWNLLRAEAAKARTHSYAPYSRFSVGAALLTEAGEIVLGCNVENASFGATCCAERVAVFAAIAQGLQRFVAMAVITEADPPALSCGICRQVLFELSPNLELLFANIEGATLYHRISDLIPYAFSLEKAP